MFRIVAINARGLKCKKKRESIFDYYRVNADILVIQETHSSKEDEQIWQNEWGAKALFDHGETNARGIAIFVVNRIYMNIRNVERSLEGQQIVLDILENDQIITLVAIYAPNKDSPNFFEEIQKLLEDRSENKIIIGDFNLTLDVDKDRLNTYNNNNKSKDKVLDIMDQFCMTDVWRNRNEETREYSWRKMGQINKASRIDYALVSAGLDQKIPEVCYIPGIQTDHRAIYMVVEVSNYDRGRGFWKLNTSLLQSQEYLTTTNMEIQKTLETTINKTPLERWELLKARIKKHTIEFAKNKVSEDKIIIGNLSEQVNEYESKLPLTQEQDSLLQKTKQDLEEKLLERVQGLIFRSKVRWQEGGELNTKYFFNLEKAKYNAKTCYTLVDDNNEEHTSPQEILKLQKNFYGKLYSQDEDVEFTLQNNTGIKVPENIQEIQNQQLTLEDLQVAMKKMNNNKTPGEDGLPIDFYKVFWTKLKGNFL